MRIISVAQRLGKILVVEVVEQLAGYQQGAEALPGTLKRGI